MVPTTTRPPRKTNHSKPPKAASTVAAFWFAVAPGTAQNAPAIDGDDIGGTVSGGDHVVLTFQYLVGAVAGYMETWDGHVNAAVNDFTGTVTPNNGSPAGTFALQK